MIWYQWGIHPAWEVIHDASGFQVASADSPEHALAIAVALGPVADWTRPASALQGDPGLREAVIWAVEYGGGWFQGPQASAGMLAAAEGGAAP